MKRPDLSRDHYSEFAALATEFSPAHSGPELATCVPEPALAQALARTLLSDQFELTHHASYASTGSSSTSGIAGGFTIGLARR